MVPTADPTAVAGVSSSSRSSFIDSNFPGIFSTRETGAATLCIFGRFSEYAGMQDIVKLHQPTDDLLELKHDGVTSIWFMLAILIGIVLCAAIFSYAAGTIWQVALVLLIACFVVKVMKKASAVTTVVFDRARRTVTATHRRDGAVIDETVIPFEDIANVIVDTSLNHTNRPNRAGMRPALLVGDSLVPLIWGQFLTPVASRKAVMEIRRFLDLPQADLIEDSVRALARRGRQRDAVALARHKLGLGLSRVEATRLVTEMYGGT